MIGAVMDKLAIKMLRAAERLNLIKRYSCKLDTSAYKELVHRKPNAVELEKQKKEVGNAR
jgi:hypothetical protein